MTAELPIIASAIALAIAFAILALPRRRFRWRARGALVAGAVAALIPLLAYPLLAGDRSGAHALWEWSAAAGPQIRASYRFDGLAAVGIAAALGYTTAALLAVQRASRRHAVLPVLVLAIGLVSIALAVTDDLIFATVVLGIVAALTGFAQLIVAPPSASARLAGFAVVGLQCYVVAALLVSRSGAPTLGFGDIAATSLSPGAILAASLGTALFAGMYPFVPWRYEGERAASPEREPLRGLLAMPVGLGATIVLMRLLGATEIELATLDLPAAHPAIRTAAAALILGAVAALVARRRPVPQSPLIVGGTLILGVLLYPLINWSHAILGAVLLTVVYAAAVSFALPDRWEVVRYDVTLAGLFIGLALGTPLAIAGGTLLVLAGAVTALLGAVWLPPHRAYIALTATSTSYVAAALAIGAGVRDSPDPVTQALAAIALLSLLLLVLSHIGLELSWGQVPPGLDVAAGAAAFLVTILIALLAGTAMHDALATTIGRPFGPADTSSTFVIPALAVTATLLVVLARTLRPFLPDLRLFGGRLRSVVVAADPVPAVLATFRLLEGLSTGASATFSQVEQRGGVWLAAVLILALLIWAAA